VRHTYCASLGCTWRHEDELAAKGKNSKEWAELIRRRCSFADSLSTIIQGVTDEMRALYHERLPLLPGAVETVELLHPLYPLGLASSSPPALIRYALDEAGILERFSVILSADEVGKGKPDPTVYLETARRLHLPAREIAVFEDSTAGINSAHSAHMHVIAVPNEHYPPSREALATADVTLDSLTQFSPELLDRMPDSGE
jgi:HAD superfamily hydrolase (TIGR01509 family)